MSARYSINAGLLCLGVLAIPAWATQTPANSLLEDCHAYASAPESVPAIRCEAYLRGFLDAVNGVDLESERMSRLPFGSRVARLPSRLSSFCLPADTPLAEIIAVLLHEAGDLAVDPDTVRELLLEVLPRHYPCKQAE
jgi:hypothetical protein